MEPTTEDVTFSLTDRVATRTLNRSDKLNALSDARIDATVAHLRRSATDPDIVPNAGCYRPIRIIAPEGTIINPIFPAACTGGNEVTSAWLFAS